MGQKRTKFTSTTRCCKSPSGERCPLIPHCTITQVIKAWQRICIVNEAVPAVCSPLPVLLASLLLIDVGNPLTRIAKEARGRYSPLLSEGLHNPRCSKLKHSKSYQSNENAHIDQVERVDMMENIEKIQHNRPIQTAGDGRCANSELKGRSHLVHAPFMMAVNWHGCDRHSWFCDA